MNILDVCALFHSRKTFFFQPKFLQKIGRICKKTFGGLETSKKKAKKNWRSPDRSEGMETLEETH